MNNSELPIIDAHQHFWKYNARDYVWMEEWMSVLRQDHEPTHLKPQMDSAGVTGTIAVQARQMEEETEYLLDLADKHPWICGVVGWVDFSAPDLGERINSFTRHEKLVGMRELIHDMLDPEYAVSELHMNGVGLVGRHGLTYDLLLRPMHIPAAIQLVDRFPNQRFVVDHIAKPEIATGVMEPWKTQIAELARRPHVFCKLSGMVTEASVTSWTPEDLSPYIDVCLESFGPRRLMIGSDWPVCTLAGSYSEVMSATLRQVNKLSDDERRWILHDTCFSAYVRAASDGLCAG
jgi:L-fuconolactonase